MGPNNVLTESFVFWNYVFHLGEGGGRGGEGGGKGQILGLGASFRRGGANFGLRELIWALEAIWALELLLGLEESISAVLGFGSQWEPILGLGANLDFGRQFWVWETILRFGSQCWALGANFRLNFGSQFWALGSQFWAWGGDLGIGKQILCFGSQFWVLGANFGL